MKFDLSSVVIAIWCSDVDTEAIACELIDKMYSHAYGNRAGVSVSKKARTPNEDRLIRALIGRFHSKSISIRPISVDCGANTYIFARGIPFEGLAIDTL